MGTLPAGFDCMRERRQDFVELGFGVGADHDLGRRTAQIAPVSHLRTRLHLTGSCLPGLSAFVSRNVSETCIKPITAPATPIGPGSQTGTNVIKDTVSPYPDDSGAVTTGTIDHHSALFDEITLFDRFTRSRISGVGKARTTPTPSRKSGVLGAFLSRISLRCSAV